VGLFGKQDRTSDPRPVIAEFWTWWADHRGEVATAAEKPDRAAVESLVGPAVAAIHPELRWEVRSGQSARHLLIVSGGGNLGLRVLAERWALAAPDADDEFEYAPVRRPDPSVFDSTVVVDDFDVPMGELVAGTRMDQKRGRIDVVIHHPLFPLLPEEARNDVAFRALYAALGEDDVERWLGAVQVSADAPIDAFAVSALGSVVDQLRPASAQWVVLKGKSRLGPVLATVRRPFTRVDRPMCDTYVGVTAPYPGGKDGLPADDEIAKQVQGLSDQVLAALGGDGPQAVAIGHEFVARRAFIHLYIDGLEVNVDGVADVLAQWPHRKAKLTVRADPSWRRVQRLLG
jgi:hypothetical protein